MALIGHIGEFDNTTDQWQSYKERLEQFVAANDVADEKRVPVLLSVIGGRTYELLRTLTAPQRPAEKTFEELCTVLENHLAPRPLVIAERFRFHKRHQRKDENVSDFCVAIQKLAEHCQFGTTLSDTLRDRLVCGLASEQIQRRLLTETELTYERAKAIALAAETATKDAVELRKPMPTAAAENVNKLKACRSHPHTTGATSKPSAALLCTRCGRNNHEQSSCYFKNKFCLLCSKKGHTKKMCKTKGVKSDKKGKVNLMNDPSESTSDEEYSTTMNFVGSTNYVVNKVMVKPIVVNMLVNDVPIDMELDSGSPVSLMPLKTFNQLFKSETMKLRRSDLCLSTYTGEWLKVRGYLPVNVKYETKSYELQLHIVDGGNATLLGRDWLQRIQLNWQNVHLLRSTKLTSTTLDTLKARYADLYNEQLGTLKDFQAKLHLKENTAPIFMRARPVPYAMRDRIEAELNRLESEGVLSKTNSSDWATPIVGWKVGRV